MFDLCLMYVLYLYKNNKDISKYYFRCRFDTFLELAKGNLLIPECFIKPMILGLPVVFDNSIPKDRILLNVKKKIKVDYKFPLEVRSFSS